MPNVTPISFDSNGNVAINETSTVKIVTNAYVKYCQEHNMPVIIALYEPRKGYTYASVLPEEINCKISKDDAAKFKKFMQDIIGFDKSNYMPHIKNGEEE